MSHHSSLVSFHHTCWALCSALGFWGCQVTGGGLAAGGQCSPPTTVIVTVPPQRKLQAPSVQTNQWRLQESEVVCLSSCSKEEVPACSTGLPGSGYWGCCWGPPWGLHDKHIDLSAMQQTKPKEDSERCGYLPFSLTPPLGDPTWVLAP